MENSTPFTEQDFINACNKLKIEIHEVVGYVPKEVDDEMKLLIKKYFNENNKRKD